MLNHRVFEAFSRILTQKIVSPERDMSNQFGEDNIAPRSTRSLIKFMRTATFAREDLLLESFLKCPANPRFRLPKVVELLKVSE